MTTRRIVLKTLSLIARMAFLIMGLMSAMAFLSNTDNPCWLIAMILCCIAATLMDINETLDEAGE